MSKFVNAASRDQLPEHLVTASFNCPNFNRYVRQWSLSYLVSGDLEHALSRLERAYNEWLTFNA